jgi:hypothetical protein
MRARARNRCKYVNPASGVTRYEKIYGGSALFLAYAMKEESGQRNLLVPQYKAAFFSVKGR